MLLNDVHLLPDLSGALAWPKLALTAVSVPVCGPREVPELIKRAASVIRGRRPRTVVWLGDALPRLMAAGKLGTRDAKVIGDLIAGCEWVWIADTPVEGVAGRWESELAVDRLTFRAAARPDAASGEVSGAPSPEATCQGVTLPCYVLDGRRLVLPAFGPRAGVGTNVLSPVFQPLFRRPFSVLMVGGGRIVTRARARLDAPGRMPTSA